MTNMHPALEALFELIAKHHGVLQQMPTLEQPELKIKFPNREDSAAFTREFHKRSGTVLQ